MKKQLIQTIAVFIFILISLGCSNNEQQKSESLRYSFTLSEEGDRIDVELMYKPLLSQDTILFIVPTNYDRVKFTNVQVIENIELHSKGTLTQYTLDNYHYLGDAESIRITYSIPTFSNETKFLSCEADDMFVPVINTEFFHMYGDMSLMLPRYFEQHHEFNLELNWINFPSSWHIANDYGIAEPTSEGPRQQHSASLLASDLSSSLMFGGNYRKQVFTSKDVNFHTYIYGEYGFTDQQFIDVMQKVVDAEMDLWQSFPHSKDYVMSLTQKGATCGRIGGRNMSNSVEFNLSGKFDQRYFDMLLSMTFTHEITHSWIGQNFLEKSDNWVEMKWLFEGFSDYYAFQINRKIGVMSETQYINKLNEYLELYLLSPHSSTTNQAFIDGYRYDNRLERLAYEKGAIFAFYLDGFIRRESSNKFGLDDLMKFLVSHQGAERHDGDLNFENLVEFALELIGVSIKVPLERFIINGELIPMDSPLIDSLSYTSKASFDFGFDYLESIKNEQIIGLKSNSNAYKAGLRNGQKLTAIKQLANQPNEDFIFEVQKVDGIKEIVFKPIGKEIRIPKIIKLTSKQP